MGSKLNPGAFDCFKAAMPDEPMFVLLARDLSGPTMLRAWSTRRRGEVLTALDRGDITEEQAQEDLRKCQEADACADEMTIWRKRNAGNGSAPPAWHGNLEARERAPEPTPSDLDSAIGAVVAALGQDLGIPSQFWGGAFTIKNHGVSRWASPSFRGRRHRLTVGTQGRLADYSGRCPAEEMFVIQGELVADVEAVVMDENDIVITLLTVLE